MTDYKQLCAELVDDLELCDWPFKLKETIRADIDRARAALAEPEPKWPSFSDVMEWASAIEPWATWLAPGGCLENAHFELERLVTTAVCRWGSYQGILDSSTLRPVPVSERLPGPGDCTTNPRTGEGQWCWGWVQHDPISYSGRWRMIRREWLIDEAEAWLPAHALPLPS